MLNTDCLPPSQPPKESRLDAESLPKYGRLPAPKIPPAIRGATGLASICGAGAATVTERTSPEHGLVAHLGLFSPKVSGLLAKACGGLRRPAQPDLPLQEQCFFLPGEVRLHSGVCLCPVLSCSYDPPPQPKSPIWGPAKKSLGPGMAMQ